MSLKVSVLLHSAVPDTDQAAIFTHPGPSPEAPRSAGELLAQMEAISYTCFQRVCRIRDSQRRSGASSGASPLPRINKQEVYDCLCVTKTHTHIHTQKKNETPCLCFSSPEAQKSVICSRYKNTHDVFTSGWQTDSTPALPAAHREFAGLFVLTKAFIAKVQKLTSFDCREDRRGGGTWRELAL